MSVWVCCFIDILQTHSIVVIVLRIIAAPTVQPSKAQTGQPTKAQTGVPSASPTGMFILPVFVVLVCFVSLDLTHSLSLLAAPTVQPTKAQTGVPSASPTGMFVFPTFDVLVCEIVFGFVVSLDFTHSLSLLASPTAQPTKAQSGVPSASPTGKSVLPEKLKKLLTVIPFHCSKYILLYTPSYNIVSPTKSGLTLGPTFADSCLPRSGCDGASGAIGQRSCLGDESCVNKT